MIPHDANHDEEQRVDSSQKGSSQKLLLCVLAILLAVFGYLYFFTGLIKQHGGESPVPPPQAQQIKQPMPPRPDEQATKEQAVAAKETVPPVAPATAEKAAPAASKAAPKLPPPPAAKPAAAPAKPAEIKPKVAASAPMPQPAAKPVKAEKQAVPAKPPAKAVVEKAAPQPKKVAKAAAAKPSEKQVTAKEAKKVPEKGAAAKESQPGLFRLESGEILSARKADQVVAELKKAGFTSVEKKLNHEDHTMQRLFVAEYDDVQAARDEQQKLSKTADGVFVLPLNGKYQVYAGSYELEKRAASERDRLAAKGLQVTVRKASVKVPVYRITAKAKVKSKADEMAARLKKAGVGASVQSAGK
ncbi:MAG: SPOR domain-containing protein [Geobacter sp.]|nr:SPOR domain-containing protein [Geobacter sp.]